MKKTYKFELPQNKEVEISNTRVEDGKLFVEVEFKERFEPKDGDFLVGNTGIFICKIGEKDNQIYAYAGIDNGKVCVDVEGIIWNLRSNCRYATTEEKAAFLERLEKGFHKKWNPEKKCLEDIYIPKFGDIIKFVNHNTPFKRDYLICIYPDTSDPLILYKRDFFNIANLDLDGNLSFHCANFFDRETKVYPASESEKQELFEKLAEVGKRWNPENKKLENIRWIPKNGGIYWYVTEDLVVAETRFSDINNADIFKVKCNNCFKTQEAAQKVVDQIKEIFKNSEV